RRIPAAMIRAQRVQEISQPDALVEIIQQLRKNASEPDRLILRLSTLGAEQVIDVVVTGPADCESISHARGVVAEILALYGSLDKIKGQQIAERRPHHRIIVGFARLFGTADNSMGKA